MIVFTLSLSCMSWLDLVDDAMVLVRAQLAPLERAILAMTCRYERAIPRARVPTGVDQRRRCWIAYAQAIFERGLVDLCVSMFRPLDAAVDGCPGCPRTPRRRYYDVLLPMVLKRGTLATWRAICAVPRVRAIFGFYVSTVERLLVGHANTNGARALDELLDIHPVHIPTALPRRRTQRRRRRWNGPITIVRYGRVAYQ
jgi:hypothetical protein